MTKFLTLSSQIGFLLITIVLMSMMKLSQTKSLENLPVTDISSDDSDADVEEERQMYDLNKLRRFLLTADAEQRAARREQQDFYKRELIREYLQSISNPNPNRFQEVKKRFCASFDEFYANQAACLG